MIFVLLFQGPTGFLTEAVRNAYPSVDSFFFMSGCLLSYITLKEMDALERKCGGELTKKEWTRFWIMYYVHRYIRYFLGEINSLQRLTFLLLLKIFTQVF